MRETNDMIEKRHLKLNIDRNTTISLDALVLSQKFIVRTEALGGDSDDKNCCMKS